MQHLFLASKTQEVIAATDVTCFCKRLHLRSKTQEVTSATVWTRSKTIEGHLCKPISLLSNQRCLCAKTRHPSQQLCLT